MRKQFKNKLLVTFILLFYTDLRNMSSNAALSAARRRRSNPAPSGPPAPPPANRILQRTGVGVPPPTPFNPRMPPPQQHAQMRGAPLSSRPQGQGQGQGQVQFRQPPQQLQQSQQKMQQMARPQSPGLPPLPPPVKTAGPLYGIPIHPLVMFKTHDNKLSEHDLSIGDCLEHLKEIDERLAAVESSSGSGGEGDAAGMGAAPAGDLNDLINDGAFINGVVDNIMNTTNFASIVDSIIPLKEENEALKQQVDALNGQVGALNGQVDALNGQVEEWEERIRQLEDRVRSIGSSCHIPSENVTQENNSSAQETCIGVTHEQEEEEAKEEEEEHEV